MKKALIIIGVLVAICATALTGFLFYTKSFSPEKTFVHKENGNAFTIVYCRPYKKGRQIFGSLVPYGKVWRTGANAATTFETDRDLTVKGEKLPAGKYSLWTIPEEEQWTIIFNKEHGQWGIRGNDGQVNRDAALDVLQVGIPAAASTEVVEQFTITITSEEPRQPVLNFAWDWTVVQLPMTVL